MGKRQIFLNKSFFVTANWSRTTQVAKQDRAVTEHKPREKFVSLLVAISADRGMIAYDSFLGHHTFKGFTAFIQGKSMPEVECSRTLTMDNASWHYSKWTTNILEPAGHCITFEPSYTPQFSLYECNFSLIKPWLLHQELRSHGTLQDLIAHECESLIASKIAPFLDETQRWVKGAHFEHALGYLNKAPSPTATEILDDAYDLTGEPINNYTACWELNAERVKRQIALFTNHQLAKNPIVIAAERRSY